MPRGDENSEFASELFTSWLYKDERGRYWPDPSKMPPGAAKAYGDWCSKASNKSEDDPGAQRAAQEFRDATGGFEASDLATFQVEMSRK